MSVKIADIAKQLGLTQKALKEKILELGFDIKKTARTLDEDLAELVLEELKPDNNAEDSEDAGGAAEEYESLIDKELDREIIKSQRKQTAGRDSKHKKRAEEVAKEKAAANEGEVEVGDAISVKEFAEKAGVSAAKVIGELMKNGILANINQQIDFDTVLIVAEDLGVAIRKLRTEASAEDILHRNIEALLEEDDPKSLKIRPAVVSVMGHVDHGKTSLLDAIRETDVVAGEAGGITQHIAAYQVEKKGKKITFLDTPGHEAFTAMRARGAKATDIAILVVSANEGVKPQTIEAVNHAKDAGIPILVAINKMDLPDANPEKVKGELVEHGLQPEDWGGSTVMVPVSAVTGQGISDLLDMVLLTAEMEELKANANREAVATVVEAHLDKSFGPVATVIVNTGTLKVMDNFVIGASYGRIKAMYDHNGKRIKSAPPSTPVMIAGLQTTPVTGDLLQAVKSEKIARNQAELVQDLKREGKLDDESADMSQIMSKIQSGNLKVLKVILKVDTKGSLEAIKASLAKIKSDDVALKVVHSGVGSVTDSDVMMAAAGQALIFAFHVGYSAHVAKLAEKYRVELSKYTVIYQMIDDVKAIMTGLLEPERVEVVLGKARIKEVFFTKRNVKIIGCGITNGTVENKAFAKVFRGEELLGEGTIDSLKKVDKVVSSLNEGNDCGIKFVCNFEVKADDILEVYKVESRQRTLE